MAVVSDDPTWWSTINAYSLCSYFIVAAFVAVIITEGTPSPRSQKGKEGLLPSKYKPHDSGIILSNDESIPADLHQTGSVHGRPILSHESYTLKYHYETLFPFI
ncbi:uncharacterized protein F5891DRAFT_1190943 [Suillus fuscotomentosus]|uniref:Uncharacterized protein n=1 Tax=Suillus fuscotomentosus TaxID=1912939 RepID=A0AAD4E4C9_9AGAM|nr:uncharacterized protein F5891DRAFT_1190943 [Suillus fuscotomentosus]KAG1898279.1 hypothetical protein F5891DRAFT_1190943 [Suillus fuscotomentosus]